MSFSQLISELGPPLKNWKAKKKKKKKLSEFGPPLSRIPGHAPDTLPQYPFPQPQQSPTPSWAPTGGGCKGMAVTPPPLKIQFLLYWGPFCYFFSIWGPLCYVYLINGTLFHYVGAFLIATFFCIVGAFFWLAPPPPLRKFLPALMPNTPLQQPPTPTPSTPHPTPSPFTPSNTPLLPWSWYACIHSNSQLQGYTCIMISVNFSYRK